MTATDELRRLLDERGIEHHDGEIMTYTDDADYMPSASNTFDVTLYNLTPEQSVEATLGRGTCEVERLQAENAALRRLVRYIMHQCNDGNPRCDECIGWNDGECVALQRMHEAGIGVDA